MKTRIWSLVLLLSVLITPQWVNAEEVTLKGYFFERSDGTKVHIEMVGVNMIFKLLDEDNNELENVFTRGILMVNQKGKSGKRMSIQPSSDGKSLRSVKTIRKPHLMRVSARLYKGEDDTTGELFNFYYNQHTVEEATVIPIPGE